MSLEKRISQAVELERLHVAFQKAAEGLLAYAYQVHTELWSEIAFCEALSAYGATKKRLEKVIYILATTQPPKDAPRGSE